MIIDNVQSIANYKGISSSLDKAISFIQTTDLTKLAPGRHSIEGDDIFAIVLTVKTRTRDNCRWESHKKYIEIPIVIEGNELMIGQHIANLECAQVYDSNTDNLWYEDNGQGTVINMAPDIFVIFFPSDAHMPCIMDKKPENVKKVIVKVKV